MALPERVMEIVDRGITVEEEEEASSSYTLLPTTRGKTQELLTVVLGVGVNCSAESPKERMKIDDALKELLSIRSILLKNWEAHKYEQIRRNNYPV
ncbi:hypothetical protein PanWU01x14_140980 [Parasponia andersonii]|uniref:Uncharacterized protein n=1 Tax=Parasponia andersonii TaxID=3476 RepID=A0A2P5CM74_PARAD|nr:hypothetical protein PanWU01x14_140980 [Parasponia andersonii]